MRSALFVAFVLLAISVAADRKTPFNGDTDSMVTKSPVDEVALLTLMFFAETLGTASGDHLVKGAEFDIPSAEYQRVAIIFGNLYPRLCVVRTLTEILTNTSQVTALFYTEARLEKRATTYRVHYEMLKSQMKAAPKLSVMYDVERENVSKQELPQLKTARIDVEQLRIVRMTQVVEETVQSNEKFRRLVICVRFAKYSMLTKDNTFTLTEAPERSVTAQAIIQMSQRTDIGEQVQQVYEEALQTICSRIRNEKDVARIDQLLFSILEEAFQKHKDLNAQLEATKMGIFKS